METVYERRPLSSERHIRLLEVLPEDAQGVMQCSISELSLDDVVSSASSCYNALSYTWESQKADSYIACDGQRLPITRNCEAALRRLQRHRKNDPPQLPLWIDSICICQSDVKERNAQVRMMGEIYERAHSVIVWLGQGSADTRFFFKYLDKRFLSGPQSTWFRQHWYSKYSKDLDEIGKFDVVLSIANHSWFSRVWTIQEVARARAPIVVCGEDTVPFETLILRLFRVLTDCEEFEEKNMEELIRRTTMHCNIRAVIQSRHGSFTYRLDLFKTLAGIRKCGATEAKDKIFAVYDLFKDVGLAFSPPNYDLSLGTIYWEAAKSLLATHLSLQILQLVTGFPNPELDSVPSWVPDFSDRNPPWLIENESFEATQNSPNGLSLDMSGRFLTLPGVRLDTISEVSSSHVWYPENVFDTNEDILDITLGSHSYQTIYALQDWALMARKRMKYKNRASWQEAFLSTLARSDVGLIGGRNEDDFCSILLCNQTDIGQGTDILWNYWSVWTQSGRLEPARKLIKFNSFYDVRSTAGPEESQIFLTLASWFPKFRNILTYSKNNTFFLTESGYMGVGSCAVRVGDVIVLVSGMAVPLVIRPRGDKYRLITASYVHGVMHGEAWSGNPTRTREELDEDDEFARLSKFIIE